MNKKRSLCRFVSTVNKLLIRNAISLLFSLIVIMESPTLYASGDFDRMMEAIDINDVKTVKALINKKIDLNQSPDTRAAPTFLTHAAWKGRTQIVKLLISSEADVNAVNGDEMTPLMMAARKGYTEIMRILIAAKASLNEQSKWGDTSLMLSAEQCHTEAVKLLLSSGADRTLTSDGDTALERAQKKGCTEIMKMLKQGK